MPKKKSGPKKPTNAEVNQALMENFITLQKVLTNLSLKFEDLSKNIEKLLNVFEITAKNFTEKQFPTNTESDKEFLKKLDDLLDQNKTISKGILMMEEKVKSRMSPEPNQTSSRFQPRLRPLPRN